MANPNAVACDKEKYNQIYFSRHSTLNAVMQIFNLEPSFLFVTKQCLKQTMFTTLTVMTTFVDKQTMHHDTQCPRPQLHATSINVAFRAIVSLLTR